MAAIATPLGTLLRSSVEFCRDHWKPLLVGAAAIGALFALLQPMMAPQAEKQVYSMFENIGMDAEKMEEVSKRMESGDVQGAQEAMAEVEAMMEQRFAGMDEKQVEEYMNMQGWNMVGRMMPLIGFSMLLSTLIMLIGGAYYLVLAVQGGNDPMATAKKAVSVILPLLGLSIWTFLRSFAWIPFIGWVIAIVIGPRMFAAPVILVKEGKGVMESVRLSMERTRFYWGKIVGNGIVVGICVYVLWIIVAIVTSPFLSMPFVGAWVQATLMQIGVAFMSVFGVKLALAIFERPIKA